jgi:hypothetical protein
LAHIVRASVSAEILKPFLAKQAALNLYPHWRQVTFHYFGYVLRCYVGIPDVVWVDENDGTFLMTAGACVTEHGGRRYAAQPHLFLEHLE